MLSQAIAGCYTPVITVRRGILHFVIDVHNHFEITKKIRNSEIFHNRPQFCVRIHAQLVMTFRYTAKISEQHIDDVIKVTIHRRKLYSSKALCHKNKSKCKACVIIVMQKYNYSCELQGWG